MRKFITVMAAVAILFSAAAFAEDLSALTDGELLALHQDVLDEMARRQLPDEQEAEPESDAGAASAGMVLYYQPSGGEYYHLDQNCRLVNPKYLPLEGCFLYSELDDEPYRDLKPCEICGAPVREKDRPESVSFRDAVDAAGEYAAVGGDMDYLAVAAEKDGRYFRTVTILDDRAKELYMTAMSAEDPDAANEAFKAYAWSLPVCYTEELAWKAKDQAELDAQAGKTVGELLGEGYSFYGIGGGENLPTVVELTSGLFIYEFEVDASFDYYREHGGWDGVETMKVKGGTSSVSWDLATNLDYLTDGTYQPPIVPNITAEEASAVHPVPPIEEYSMKAWPLSAEGYADLQDNMDARYGQVYLVKGVVLQVLSQSPQRVIVCTGEDGKSQPVVVECPEQRSFSLAAGDSCRIYADVSSSQYILPVLTARYMFSSPSEDGEAAAAGDEFIAPDIVPAKGIGDFIGEWQCFRIVNGDGSVMDREQMLAEGIADDRAELVITEDGISLYSASAGEVGSVKYEFIPGNGMLKILNESDDPPVLFLNVDGTLTLFMSSDLSSGDVTAYLVRRLPNESD